MGIVEKIMAIATPPSERTILMEKKRKLEKKMWRALTEDERVEYIRLHKALKEQ